MLVNNIKFERLSYLQNYYEDNTRGIPQKSGIYYWVYWPDFDPNIITLKQLEDRLKEYTRKHLIYTERIVGKYKFEAIIGEQGYPSKHDTIFGLTPSKNIKLLNYLNTQANIVFFAAFFKDVCFSRPFYIGKANDLRKRLVTQHFRGTTEILGEITQNGIPLTDIWVGYKEIPDTSNDEINNIFEEIFSRRVKPGLTKKPN